jgi:hypothetical protein
MNKSIPKVVHISWVDKRILFTSQNPLALNGVAQMKKINPNWVIQISDDCDVNDYIQSCISNDDWLLLKDRHIVEKVDIWRLLKIFHEGGVYCDIDRYCNIPFDSFIDKNTRCVLPTHFGVDCSQDIMIASKGSPIHKLALELNLSRRRDGCDDVLTLGPVTYFHAVTQIILGKQKSRFLPADEFLEFINLIHNKEGYKVFYERPVEDITKHTSLIYKPQKEFPFITGNGGTREDLYAESKTRHWTTADNVFGEKKFGI